VVGAVGRVAVITGAAGGLGRIMARHFASQGYGVACADLPSDRLDRLARELKADSFSAVSITCDLSEKSQIDAMIAGAAKEFGRIDVLVNNAATYALRPWTEITEAEWNHTIAVNLRGCFLTARASFEHLKASGHGRIVNVASSTFFTGWSGLLDYVSSKGGIIGFTRSLAREIGPHGVTVNAVSPGAIRTAAEDVHLDHAAFEAKILDSQSVKRRGTPQDIAAAVAFFASPEAGFITGQTLEVDGGWVMP
jgi:3-oxoacyl-[acyl-carrier protein] reductase